MSAEITFTTGFAFVRGAIFAAGAADTLKDFTAFTRIVEFNEPTPPHWWKHDNEFRVCSITYFGPQGEDYDDAVCLSEEGDVRYIGNHTPLLEKIPGAGVYSPDAEGWGYLSDMQQIGEHLYAAGYSGQVYKRLGPNQWVHMDDGILQACGLREGQYSIQVINGPSEDDIYVAGCTNEPYYPVRASHWDGAQWQDLTLPDVAERITNIYVESEARIWLCGANGTLLLGNARDGFKSLSTVDDNQLFLSLCLYRERIVLASNLGLFYYDPAQPQQGIRKLNTTLKPDVQDANIVEAVEGVLWSIGPKDIVRHTENGWERIDHPDNPPIR